MRTIAVFGEGRDDVAAIRALLRAMGAKEEARRTTTFAPSEGSRQLRYLLGETRILLQGVQGKSKLANDALLTVQGGSTERPEALVVCFDPDGAAPGDWFGFFLRAVRELRPADGGTYRLQIDGRVVHVIPAPWHRADAAAFASLLDEHNLERVLIGGVLASEQGARLRGWAGESTSALMSLVEGHGWKRAFRIWCAALFPDSEAFVDRLLQDAATRDACLAALQATPVWNALRLVLPPTS